MASGRASAGQLNAALAGLLLLAVATGVGS